MHGSLGWLEEIANVLRGELSPCPLERSQSVGYHYCAAIAERVRHDEHTCVWPGLECKRVGEPLEVIAIRSDNTPAIFGRVHQLLFICPDFPANILNTHGVQAEPSGDRCYIHQVFVDQVTYAPLSALVGRARRRGRHGVGSGTETSWPIRTRLWMLSPERFHLAWTCSSLFRYGAMSSGKAS
jgi:hypothetical protein